MGDDSIVLCRLCLARMHPENKGSSILDESFRMVLMEIFKFKIKHDERFPADVCKACTWSVRDFYCFSVLVETNQAKLREEHSVHSRWRVVRESTPEDSSDNDQSPAEVVDTSFAILENLIKDEKAENRSYPDATDEMDDDSMANGDLSDGSFDNTSNSETLPHDTVDIEEYKISPTLADDVMHPEATDTGGTVGLATESDVEDTAQEGPEKHMEICIGGMHKDLLNNNGTVTGPPQVRRNVCSVCCKTMKNPPRGTKIDWKNIECSLCVKLKYRCKKCKGMFETPQQLSNHMRTHVYVQCSICDRQITFHKFWNHILNHASPKNCDVCKMSFYNNKLFKEHMNSQHATTVTKKKTSTSKGKGKKGVRVKRAVEKKQCPVCKKFVTQVNRHLKVHKK